MPEQLKDLDDFQKAELVKNMIFKRTGIPSKDLDCPRAKSEMTPCIAKDGESACTKDGICVGCGMEVEKLYYVEKSQEKKGDKNDSIKG